MARTAHPQAASASVRRYLDPTYRPPPLWGCEAGLPAGAFHVVVATLAPEPAALVPWIWNLGLSGAEIWIYHRLAPDDPRLAAAAATLASFEPYPCNATVRLQPLLPNKGREAAVYLSHIVRQYDNLPKAIAFVHDHGPAARHSLCGPFFRRVRGYYAGIVEQQAMGGSGWANGDNAGGSSVGGVAGTTGWDADVGDGAEAVGAEYVVGDDGTLMEAPSAGGGKRMWTRTAPTVRRMMARFADMVVSLSSGCQENWLKGCCARLVCSSDDEHYTPASTSEAVTSASTSTGQRLGRSRGRQLFEISGLGLGLNAAEPGGGGGGVQEGGGNRGQEGAGGEVVWDLDTEAARHEALVEARRARAADAEAEVALRAPQGRCPFRTPRCLADSTAMEAPLRLPGLIRNPVRWIYLHGAGGLYDPRYENTIVLYGKGPGGAAAEAMGGVSNAGFGPLTLVRYAGPYASETVRMQTSAGRHLDYPESDQQRNRQQTLALLNRLFRAHNYTGKRIPGGFKSCCASLILRARHVKQWSLNFYEELLSYTLDPHNSYHASLAVSHHGWGLWPERDSGSQDLLRYFEMDFTLLQIRGCPGWRMINGNSSTPG